MTGPVSALSRAAVLLVGDRNDATHRCQVLDEVPVTASRPGIVAEQNSDWGIAHLAGVLTQLRRWGDRAAGRQVER